MLSDFLVSVITSGVTSGILFAGVAWLGKLWVAERIKNEVSHIYALRLEEYRTELKKSADKELELLRAQVTETRALHAAVTAAFSAAQSAASERKLRAVETLWAAVLKTKKAANSFLSTFDIMTPEETEKALSSKNPNVIAAIRQLDWERMRETYELLDPDPETLRPFINEALWTYFNGYRLFLGRIIASYIMGRHQNQIRHWTKDKMLAELLENLLTPEERAFVWQVPAGHIARASGVIEQKMLKSAHDIVSGRISTNATLEETQRIKHAIDEANIEQGKRAVR